jgi:hypothetical protein
MKRYYLDTGPYSQFTNAAPAEARSEITMTGKDSC